jgi:hypothetical protein
VLKRKVNNLSGEQVSSGQFSWEHTNAAIGRHCSEQALRPCRSARVESQTAVQLTSKKQQTSTSVCEKWSCSNLRFTTEKGDI